MFCCSNNTNWQTKQTTKDILKRWTDVSYWRSTDLIAFKRDHYSQIFRFCLFWIGPEYHWLRYFPSHSSIAFICSIKRIIKLMGEKNCCEEVPGFQWRKSTHLFRCIWNLSHLFLSIACRPSWNRKYISVFELKYVPIFVWLSCNLKVCNIRFYVEVIFVSRT